MERNEVGTSEADQALLRCQPGIISGNHKLPVTNGGSSHPLALTGMLDTPAHGLLRRAGTTASVSVHEDGAFTFGEYAHLRTWIELAVTVQVAEDLDRRDAVVWTPMELRVNEEPGQSLGIVDAEL